VKAEEIFNNAKSMGLKGSIFRIGTLTGRVKDGCFQVNMKENALYSRIIVILKSKILPGQILNESIEFTPVDCCCKAFVKIISDMPEEIFHLSNDNTITYQELLAILKELDIIVSKKENLAFSDYLNYSQQLGIREELYIGFYMHLKRNEKRRAQLQYDYTKQYLSDKGFCWPKIDKDYVEKIVNYIRIAAMERG
jgi:fengycin family lipopeptide synthetase D